MAKGQQIKVETLAGILANLCSLWLGEMINNRERSARPQQPMRLISYLELLQVTRKDLCEMSAGHWNIAKEQVWSASIKKLQLVLSLQQCWSIYLPLWSTLKYLLKTTITWIAITLDIYGPQRMKPTDFGDPLTFPAAQSFHLFCETSQHMTIWEHREVYCTFVVLSEMSQQLLDEMPYDLIQMLMFL